jgi:hypothetical protein
VSRRGFRSQTPADPFMYGLLATLAVVGILLLLTLWIMRVQFTVGCEPVFPDLQLPTLSGRVG